LEMKESSLILESRITSKVTTANFTREKLSKLPPPTRYRQSISKQNKTTISATKKRKLKFTTKCSWMAKPSEVLFLLFQLKFWMTFNTERLSFMDPLMIF
jgi:ribosomal 50S subunit-associated protein YjgA (DUF615 family)